MSIDSTIPTWERGSFGSLTASGPIAHVGYVRGPFGISKFCRDWTIFHLPTGYTFLYSDWPTLGEAKRFAEALADAGDWSSKTLHRKPDEFNAACHSVAKGLGHEARRYVAI